MTIIYKRTFMGIHRRRAVADNRRRYHLLRIKGRLGGIRIEHGKEEREHGWSLRVLLE